MEIDVNEIIVKTTAYKSGHIVGFAKLQYRSLVIKFFTIREGKYENSLGNKLFVQPPSIQNKNGRYSKICYFENISLWRRVEAKIITDYLNNQKMRGSQHSEDISEEENERIAKDIEQNRGL